MDNNEIFTKEYRFLTNKYWTEYIKNCQPLPQQLPFIRPVILDSWRRSQRYGVDQNCNETALLSPSEIDNILDSSQELIEVSHSYLLHLAEFIRGTNFVLALTDQNGYVIDIVVEDSGIKGLMRQTNLRIGSIRNEQTTGTSGIAICLATGTPIQIWGEEHYIQSHHTYFCSAAPIFDVSKKLMGCLAMIGPQETAHTHTFGMVCTAVDGIQKEMQMRVINQQLSFVNTQLNDMIQALSSGVILLDEDKRIVHYNDNALSILELPKNLKLQDKYVGDVILTSALTNELWDSSVNNMEITLETYQGRSVNVVFTSVITHGLQLQAKNIIFIFEKQKRIHQLVRKMSGFTATYTFDSLIGQSSQMQSIKEMGKRVAQSASNVLILGESGTGKELLAQSIHNASERAKGPFIAINCGSIPKTLIESELFGYESGSFTGARREGNPGKFELADGGTLFLDEIGDMPLELQASLLRVLENHEVIRIGGKQPKYVDVKVIAATNANLLESAKNGRFRQDLYYRLNVLSIRMPPLRERIEDIPILATYFINTYTTSLHKQITHISEEVIQALKYYDWPGNVRELENVIERAINLMHGDTLTITDLPPELFSSKQEVKKDTIIINEATTSASWIPCRSPEISERETILTLIKREKGHIKSVASTLNMPVRTLYRKLKKYNIDPKLYRSWTE